MLCLSAFLLVHSSCSIALALISGNCPYEIAVFLPIHCHFLDLFIDYKGGSSTKVELYAAIAL